jgi:predicted component of viral defense system (DUF524 family)
VYLFDPKYKLEGELIEGESADGKPKKTDIDKMHAYRDAVRGEDGIRVVRYAAILYPGPEVRYSEGLEALRAYPGADQDLEKRIRILLRRALRPTSEAESEVPDPA